MCGICGYSGRFDVPGNQEHVLDRMTASLVHRGPDSSGKYMNDNVGLGFRRLSLVDLAGGNQPLKNEDGSVVLICNGEIYNYEELKKELLQDHHFATRSDVEVILHLYEECGPDLLNKLNGQFAFALYDNRTQTLLLARDPFGICPLYYTVAEDVFIFGSEIKAILEHPLVKCAVDLTGLDQILSFPGLVSPRTMLKGIHSLKGGHYLLVNSQSVQDHEYWDLNYPRENEACYDKNECQYLEELQGILEDSVRLRLKADVPVGFYLSGGLDSSLIAALIHKLVPGQKLHSFAIDFEDKTFSERKYQNLVARSVGSDHHTITFGWQEIAGRLARVIRHCECPIKETYNTASLALSECVRSTQITAVLTGEGADELFAGYVGYRFDRFRQQTPATEAQPNIENTIREQLWGEPRLFYERDYGAFSDLKRTLYAQGINETFPEFNCLNHELVDREKIRGRQFVHQRSYLDFKLRMSDHLLSDHGDRMALANSVEGRYPFLDPRLAELATRMPPYLKLNGYVEK
ncbi:MAG: asparagine synthase (glutamine-hydrolyzing), partial [Candidatus Angelobacter sp.]